MEVPKVEASRIGGDLAVDFLNTVSWRLDAARRREKLTSYAHVLGWMATVALMDDGEARELAELASANPDTADRWHARILELRDDIYEGLTGGRNRDVSAHAVVEAMSRSILEPAAEGWRSRPRAMDLPLPFDVLALELLRFVCSPEVARFHRCEDAQCGDVFVDTSRQRNRRWSGPTIAATAIESGPITGGVATGRSGLTDHCHPDAHAGMARARVGGAGHNRRYAVDSPCRDLERPRRHIGAQREDRLGRRHPA